jgi:hypothetical protein
MMDVFYYVSYQTIYVFSTLELQVLKFYTNSKNFIDANFKNNFNIEYDVEFVFDGVSNWVTNKELTEQTSFYKNICYDFIIYSEYDKTLDTTNKIIMYHFPKDFSYVKSDVRFMLSEILIGDEVLKVDFATNKYNFYVVNNEFDQKFLRYFLNKYYRDKYCYDNIKENDIGLNIIDHNVEKAQFDSKNILKIQKTDYIKIQKTDYIKIEKIEKIEK